MNNERNNRTTFVVTDFLTTSVGWLMFNLVRYFTIDDVNFTDDLGHFLLYRVVLLGQLFVPLMMMCIYWLTGFYNSTFSKSRLEVVADTAWAIVIGVIIVYFVAIIDDPIPDRYSNYILLLLLTVMLGVPVLSGRLVITVMIRNRIKTGRSWLNALIVGEPQAVRQTIKRLETYRHAMGLKVVAVSIPDDTGLHADKRADRAIVQIPFDELKSECEHLAIDRVILAVKPDDSDRVLTLVRSLYCLELPVMLPAWCAGSTLNRIKINNITGEPLTDIASVNVTPSQRNIKRVMDVVVSVFALIFTSPLLLTLAIMVKNDSKGPVIYRQERIGMHRRRFMIYKFRTMYSNAESEGPKLSTDNDSRITHLGHFLRKYRLDELPQFWNILKGDMSLVGPRPEREYYETMIVKRAPHYTLVHQVRPGLTSWGMVKYGYASNVDQMVERLGYDMIYLENVSIGVDIKIMFHTIKTVITGKGI